MTPANVTKTASGGIDVGLALAGGGYRAMLFDLGSLWRLNELGWLSKIDMITSVSGGSITNAVMAMQWKYLCWFDGVAQNFESIIARPIINFADETIDAWAIGRGLISPDSSVSEQVARAYDRYLFRGTKLQDCGLAQAPDHTPRFLFYATSLQTGVSVRIERKRLADYRVGEIPNPNLSMAKIVASSSAFPPFLSPSILDLDPSLWVRTEGADLFDNERFRSRMVLTDGGAYDNMGLQALERCSTVIVCDAGAPLDAQTSPSPYWLGQTLRTMDIMTEQTRALRRRMLMDDFGANLPPGRSLTGRRKRGVYWRLKTRIGDYGMPDALVADSERTAALQHVRTRLNRFTAREKGELVNWGYALADAAMRRYVMSPTGPLDHPIPSGRLPVPEWPL
jgi:NTE family protein